MQSKLTKQQRIKVYELAYELWKDYLKEQKSRTIKGTLGLCYFLNKAGNNLDIYTGSYNCWSSVLTEYSLFFEDQMTSNFKWAKSDNSFHKKYKIRKTVLEICIAMATTSRR